MKIEKGERIDNLEWDNFRLKSELKDEKKLNYIVWGTLIIASAIVAGLQPHNERHLYDASAKLTGIYEEGLTREELEGRLKALGEQITDEERSGIFSQATQTAVADDLPTPTATP